VKNDNLKYHLSARSGNGGAVVSESDNDKLNSSVSSRVIIPATHTANPLLYVVFAIMIAFTVLVRFMPQDVQSYLDALFR
jgi:hypothetical protein